MTEEQYEINRYKFVTSQIRYHNEKMIEVFKYFITLFSATIGGVFWLLSQETVDAAVKIDIVDASRFLVVLMGLSIILLIVSNAWSWWGYRKAESKILRGAVKPPRKGWSSTEQIIMILVIIIFMSGYCYKATKIIPNIS